MRISLEARNFSGVIKKGFWLHLYALQRYGSHQFGEFKTYNVCKVCDKNRPLVSTKILVEQRSTSVACSMLGSRVFVGFGVSHLSSRGIVRQGGMDRSKLDSVDLENAEGISTTSDEADLCEVLSPKSHDQRSLTSKRP